jgi:hypothetical protein
VSFLEIVSSVLEPKQNPTRLRTRRKRDGPIFPVTENPFPDNGTQIPCSGETPRSRIASKNGPFLTDNHVFSSFFATFPCISADFLGRLVRAGLAAPPIFQALTETRPLALLFQLPSGYHRRDIACSAWTRNPSPLSLRSRTTKHAIASSPHPYPRGPDGRGRGRDQPHRRAIKGVAAGK